MSSTRIERDYKFQVLKPGETTFSSTTVDLEFSSTQDPVHITKLRQFGGQKVRPARGRVRSLPWEIGIGETTNEEVTGSLNLSTALGPDMMSRVARLQVAEGGANYQTRAGGRISDLSVDHDKQHYVFSNQDELHRVRAQPAFSSNNTQVAPHGPSTDFFFIKSPGNGRWHVFNNKSNGFAQIRPLDDSVVLPIGIAEEIVDDVVAGPVAGATNFTNLRFRTTGGTTYGVEALFGSEADTPARGLEDAVDASTGGVVGINQITLATTELQSDGSAGNTIRSQKGAQVIDGFMHAFGRDPSSALPLHIGGSSGIDPMKFVQDRYQDAGAKLDSSVFTNHSTNTPKGLFGHPRIKPDDLFLRITEPTSDLQRWLEENIYEPLGVASVTVNGEISPRYMRQPDAERIPSTTELFTFTSTNIADRHPTWSQETGDQITVLETDIRRLVRDQPAPGINPQTGDLLRVREGTKRTVHQSSIFGERSVRMTLRGLAFPDVAHDRIAHDIFQRFGNGPIRADFRGMSDASTVQQGDFVVIDIPTLPKAPDALRGGKQIFQILSRTGTPKGPQFESLELGPEAQPLSAPNLSMTKSSTEPNHAVDVTVTNLAANAKWDLQLAAQSSQPGGSSEWTRNDLTADGFDGKSTETKTIAELPFGETIWGRAQAKRRGRIGSDWSSAVNVTLSAPSAPSALAISSTEQNSAVYTWTAGSTRYATQVLLGSTLQQQKVAGSQKATLTGLAEDHTSTETLTGSVKHVGPYGGETTEATATFSLSTGVTESPDMLGLVVADGFFGGSTISGSSLILF